MAPNRPTWEEILRWGCERDNFLRGGGVENTEDDPVKLHGVKRKSIFFNLSYWKVHVSHSGVQCMDS